MPTRSSRRSAPWPSPHPVPLPRGERGRCGKMVPPLPLSPPGRGCRAQRWRVRGSLQSHARNPSPASASGTPPTAWSTTLPASAAPEHPHPLLPRRPRRRRHRHARSPDRRARSPGPQPRPASSSPPSRKAPASASSSPPSRPYPPSAILNLTGFALGLDGLDDKSNPFAGTDAPVIQLIQAGRPEAQWAADTAGPHRQGPRHAGRPARTRRPPSACSSSATSRRPSGTSAPSARSPPTPPTPPASAAPSPSPKNWSTLRAHPARRAPRRHRPRQLPHPRRPPRQRRRLRRAAVDGGDFAGAGGGGLCSALSPTLSPEGEGWAIVPPLPSPLGERCRRSDGG